MRPVPECPEMSRNVSKSDFGTLRDIFGIFEETDAPVSLRRAETLEKNPFKKSVEPNLSRKLVFAKNLKCPEMSRNSGVAGSRISGHFGTSLGVSVRAA